MTQPMPVGSIARLGKRTRASVITGRVLTGIAAAFFAFDLAGKLFSLQQTVEATTRLGYAASVLLPLGIVQVICLALYLIPRTAVIGAVLLTGYLGGAVASHVRASGSVFEIVFPLIFASMVWGGLYLRDARVAAMIAPRRKAD